MMLRAATQKCLHAQFYQCLYALLTPLALHSTPIGYTAGIAHKKSPQHNPGLCPNATMHNHPVVYSVGMILVLLHMIIRAMQHHFPGFINRILPEINIDPLATLHS
jgi:hypothetical protein